MARWIRTAVTDESTPPLNPRITFLSPTVSRIPAIASRAKDFMLQERLQPQMSKRKFLSMAPPRGVWATSGWNCTPTSLRRGSAAAAKRVFGVEAVA